ncbi:MAG: MoxR family ATPase, partial [Planctomycetota bacterium]
EAMAEKQVTVDNATHALEDLFLVIATQNPLDQVGTYPLPAAQLDRFLFKVQMTYLTREAELEVLANKYPHCQTDTSATNDVVQAAITASPADIVEARTAMQHNILVNPKIQEALVDIAVGLRTDPRVRQGLSTRSLVVAIPALQARALTQGRDFVSPDDVKALSTPIFKHRLELMPGVSDADEVIDDVMAPIMEAIA